MQLKLDNYAINVTRVMYTRIDPVKVTLDGSNCSGLIMYDVAVYAVF